MVVGCPKCKRVTKPTMEEAVRGYCNECFKKDHTCDVCGEHVEYIWVNEKKGRGHRECIERK